jgi:hypothetical protein
MTPRVGVIYALRGGADKSLALKKTSEGIGKKFIYSTYPPPPGLHTHTYGFVVLTSLTWRRNFLLVVLEIGKAKDLSALLRILQHSQASIC